VIILDKMRAGLTALRVEAWGERRDEVPRRYTRLRLRFVASGPGVDEAKLRRAVDLSVEKYCSVMHSLDPGLPVECEVVVEQG
jgi:putative redox protein